MMHTRTLPPAAAQGAPRPASNPNVGKPSASTVHEPTQEEIRKRAFELYVARNRVPGHDKEDWAQAEKELRAKAQR